ncbi:MAG: nuclear transport factor 2 family protein [Actinomycetota bacterium]
MSSTEDRLAIRELAERYADAVCRRDADDWGATWAPEGAWDLGGHVVEGRSKLVPFWTTTMQKFPFVVQIIHSVIVDDVDGDSATARCWLGEQLTDGDGNARSTVGHYVDELVKIEGRWHYLRRTYQTVSVADVTLSMTNPLGSD